MGKRKRNLPCYQLTLAIFIRSVEDALEKDEWEQIHGKNVNKDGLYGCSKCKKFKDKGEFCRNKNKKRKRQSQCKACRNAREREVREYPERKRPPRGAACGRCGKAYNVVKDEKKETDFRWLLLVEQQQMSAVDQFAHWHGDVRRW